jgi:hypothetical protein
MELACFRFGHGQEMKGNSIRSLQDHLLNLKYSCYLLKIETPFDLCAHKTIPHLFNTRRLILCRNLFNDLQPYRICYSC